MSSRRSYDALGTYFGVFFLNLGANKPAPLHGRSNAGRSRASERI
jgi:hypothetical protein